MKSFAIKIKQHRPVNPNKILTIKVTHHKAIDIKKKLFKKKIIFNNSTSRDKYKSSVSKLLSIITRRGLKLSATNKLNLVDSDLRNLLIFFNTSAEELDGSYYSIFYANKEFNLFKNLDNILEFTFEILYSIFEVRVITLNKKKQKKKDKIKYSREFFYLTPAKRKKYFLKNIYLYASRFGNTKHSERLLNSILLTFLHQRNSFLFKKKIYCYKNIYGSIINN